MNNKRYLNLFVVLFTLGLMVAGPASAVQTVNFDTYPDGTAVPSMTIITNQYQSIGVIFSGVTARDLQGTEGDYAQWLQTNYPDAYSSSNVGSVQAGNAQTLTNMVVSPDNLNATFVDPVTGQAATTDMFSVRFYDTEIGSIIGNVKAYDLSGSLIADVTHYTPQSTFDTITISMPGIASVNMSTDADGADMDNIQFNPVQVVPAPGAILLGGIGIGVIGWLRGRRTI